MFFKLRLGALIPRSVGWSVGLSVLQKLQKITKHYKTLENITKHQGKESLPPPLIYLDRRQGSFGSMPELP